MPTSPRATSPPPGVVTAADDTDGKPRFTFVEFFAGVGGFRVALEASGGKCLLACEYCRFASTTYCLNWPGSRADVVGDIHKIAAAQVPRHDIFAAGFPCQSFSNAGRLGRFLDERGKLFYEMVRIIRGCQPRALLLENVRGLLTDHETLAEVCAALADAGFPDVQVRLLDAALLVPQRRQRCFLVAFRDADARAAFAWPSLPSIGRVVDDILEHPLGKPAPPDAHLTLPVEKWRRVASSSYFGSFPGARLLPGGAVAQTLQATYKSGCLLYSQFVPQAPMDQYPKVAHSAATAVLQQHQVPEGEDEAAAAAASMMGLQSLEQIGPAPRFFSPRECARLMGFPESFTLPRVPEGVAYKQMGNAVSPPLVGALGVAVARALEAGRTALPAVPAFATPHLHADAAEALQQRAQRSSNMLCEAQCEAMATALELALKAAPAGREPRFCSLPAAAHAALCGASFEAIAAAAAEAREAATPNCAPGPQVVAADCWWARRVRGASYHEPSDPNGSQGHKEGWHGPFPIHLVLDVARTRCGHGSQPPAAPQPLQPQPEQTIPPPTHALKAEMAARCMRPFLMASVIRGSPPA